MFLFRSSVGAPPDPRGCQLDFPSVEWLLNPFSFSVSPDSPESVLPSIRFFMVKSSSASHKTKLFSADFVVVLNSSPRAVFQVFAGGFPVLFLSHRIKSSSFSHSSRASLVVSLSRI
jgi:hypothetical protein